MASGNSHKRRIQFLESQDKQLSINWEEVICPICLDFPHNGVLLQCSSYHKGCRPFMCDTDHTLSNCLNRFKRAFGLPSTVKVSSSTTSWTSGESIQPIPSNTHGSPTCPLCRGEVTGWVIVDEARTNLNMKKRCCEENDCTYTGDYAELQAHAKQRHPDARPAEIDPARQLDWENFQESSEIIDVLSMIHSEVPHGVVLGDYVIEYGDESGDEYEDFPGDEGNWWTSCILYQVFDNFRASRNRRRSRPNELTRNHQGLAYDAPYMEEGSTSSLDAAEYRFDETDDEFSGSGITDSGVASRRNSSYRSYRRRRSRFNDP